MIYGLCTVSLQKDSYDNITMMRSEHGLTPPRKLCLQSSSLPSSHARIPAAYEGEMRLIRIDKLSRA